MCLGLSAAAKLFERGAAYQMLKKSEQETRQQKFIRSVGFFISGADNFLALTGSMKWEGAPFVDTSMSNTD